MTQDSLIESLRSRVSSDPEDARSMALLANLLMERMKSSGTSSDEHEAISLAKTSITLAPENSIGYAVLSTISSLKFQERMGFLRTAVDLEQESLRKDTNINASSHVAIATSLLRLLIEPREEMAQNKDKLTAKKIMREDFCVNSLTGFDERTLYKELDHELDAAKNIIWKRREERWKRRQKGQGFEKDHKQSSGTFSLIPLSIQCLAKAQYRLGTFFRTLYPHFSHRITSIRHFRSVLELLKLPYMNLSYTLQSQSSELHDLVIKANFWLATFQQDYQDLPTNSDLHDNVQVDRCPSEYVISLYSSFAATFDNQLVKKLKYETPTKLRKLVNGVSRGTKCFHNCADLGCGTGLSGIAFRDFVEENLIGVDLSAEMVEKAKERGCYDLLHVGDVEQILTDSACPYDLIVACDVFVYIGNLKSIFESVAKSLTNNHALFAFSTELLDEEKETVEDAGFLLQSCARFAHKQCYIRKLAKDCGFVVRDMKKDVIRKNGGCDVNGVLTVLSLG